MHVERTGSFRLPLPPEQALPLFTAEGERAWAEDWDPEPLWAPGGTLAAAGAAFRTAAHGEETLWLVLAYDAAAGRAEYARVTPGSRLGTVHVRCAPDGAGGTEVAVTYRLTSLAPAGEAVLAALTEPAYAAMLTEWRTRILAALAGAGGAA